jgi:outer membrane protein assembly factor BamE
MPLDHGFTMPRPSPRLRSRLAHLQSPRLAPTALAATLVLAALQGGCVYRMNIQQGNYLEAKTVEQVQVGMTRSQVRFLLGTPMVADTFNPNRWDYLYYLREGRTRQVQQQHFVVWFEDEKVSRIDRPTDGIATPKLPTTPGA